MKKIKKRKIKAYLKKIFIFACIFFGIFFISTFIIFFFFYPKDQIISPISLAFSRLRLQVLGINTDALVSHAEKLLTDHHIVFSTVSVKDANTISVALSDGTEVLLSSRKDLSSQIDSLQLTTQRLTIQGKHISRIDLRFDRPVVSF